MARRPELFVIGSATPNSLRNVYHTLDRLNEAYQAGKDHLKEMMVPDWRSTTFLGFRGSRV